MTATQVGAATAGDVDAAIATHSGDSSAHHAKTTSFGELSDQAADAQIPEAISRDAELAGHAGDPSTHHVKTASFAELVDQIADAQLPDSITRGGEVAGVPAGAVMFFALAACPVGWSEYAPARGRLLAGLPQGGTLQGDVGSPYTNLEARTHSHNSSTVTATAFVPHDHIWSLYIASSKSWLNAADGATIINWGDGMDNVGAGWFPLAADDSTPSTTFRTTSASGSHAHVLNPDPPAPANVPRHQLLVCVKD